MSNVVNESRRDFFQLVGKDSAMVELLSTIPFKFNFTYQELVGREDLLKHDKIGWGACTVNCGSLCGVKLFVKDGKVAWVETDNEGDDEYGKHQVRACVRGRAIRHKIHNDNRIKYPMKRIGKRGEGKFQRISWDEAITMIADKIVDIKKRYGNEAFFFNYASGTVKGNISKSQMVFQRLMSFYGGYLGYYGTYSNAQYYAGLETFYGVPESSNIAGIVNSDLLVMFGNNMLENRMSGGGASYELIRALEHNKIPVVVVDPRLSDTGARVATKWIPIRPGTDTALIASIVYVMLQNNWQNQDFLDKYCQGFDSKTMPADAPKNGSYKDYVMGTGDDKTPKTPEWATKITGVAVDDIIELATMLGKSQRPFIVQGWGPQRNSIGEDSTRAIATLACVKGFGVPGTNAGTIEGGSGYVPVAKFLAAANPVKKMIPVFNWVNATYQHEKMNALTAGVKGGDKLDVPIKFLFSTSGNFINQHADFKKTADLLSNENNVEFILDINVTLTPSGKYADLVLPAATTFEQLDVHSANWENLSNRPYAIVSTKAIEPLYESKTSYDIALSIAEKLGIEKEFSEGRTQDEWAKYLWEESRKNDPKLPTFEQMLRQGIYKADAKPLVTAFEKFVADPIANKLGTPSGKIEIYSPSLADKAKSWQMEEGNQLSPIPSYWSNPEGYLDKQREKFPIQCLGYHYKGRTHSSYWEVEAIREINPEYVWVSQADADARGIKHGDTVHIFNDRGTVELIAYVTKRIRPGVTTFPEGAWRKLNDNGVDIGGTINTLASDKPTPLAKGNGTHSILVDIKKA